MTENDVRRMAVFRAIGEDFDVAKETLPMEEAEEIRKAIMEVVRAFGECDSVAWAQLWSKTADDILLGTDPRELWNGFETIVSLQIKQFEERGPLVFEEGETFAYRHGNFGWVHATSGMWAGNSIPSRFTGVFRLEGADWKLVHLHKSLAFRNENVGQVLTTSIDQIAEAVVRERPSLSGLPATSSEVTIVFTDIEGSTKLIEQVGEALWLKQLKAHNTLIREKVALHAGQVVKSLGDGFMLAFASPFDALSCAVAIQRATNIDGSARPSMPVRIGVHLGDAFRELDDFYGRTVVLASRLAIEARGGEIVVSQRVRQALEGSGEFIFEGTAEVELRGFSELQKTASLRWR